MLWSLNYRALRMLAGIGVLLWGIVADIFPSRRLFLFVGLSLPPAAAALWALGGPPAYTIGVYASGALIAGLVCLPWVLLAESLPTRHFASIAVGIAIAGSLVGTSIGASSAGLLIALQGFDTVLWIGAGGGIVVTLVASRLPRVLKTESLAR